MFRRRPGRTPHPDPLVEAALQNIITCRRMIAAKEKQAEHDRRQIRKLDRAVLRQRGMDLSGRERLAETLRREVRDLQQDIVDLQGAIADQANAMEPDHMLWL